MVSKMFRWLKHLLRRPCLWKAVVQSCTCDGTCWEIRCVTHLWWYTGHLIREKAVYIACIKNDGRDKCLG